MSRLVRQDQYHFISSRRLEIKTKDSRLHLCHRGTMIIYCVARNNTTSAVEKPRLPPGKPHHIPTYVDTTDGPSPPSPPPAADVSGAAPPKMSHVLGQLKLVQPATSTTTTTDGGGGGDYSSIDLLRTAGARAHVTSGDGGPAATATSADQPQNVYGPLLMQQQQQQQQGHDADYVEIGIH